MPELVRPFYQDPFSPVLLSADSVVLPVSNEQKNYIRKVLEKSSSDSKFAEKAYAAIELILTKGITKIPSVTSLTPNSVEIGDPTFTLHVHGTGFKNTDKIVFAGQLENTVFVSATELTTIVDMSLWLGPDVLPVEVVTAEGLVSNNMTFTFTDGSAPSADAFTAKSKTLVSHPITDQTHEVVKEKK